MTSSSPFGPNNPLFDDMARVASGAMGAFSGVRQEVEVLFRQQMERFVASLNLVPRDEFDAMADLARSAAEQVEALNARVATLEAALGAAAAPSTGATSAAPEEPSVQRTPESTD
ncbi:MAG: accessory factor UbiK family protein [Alphaproteobacteria bacterium]|nr:accessory factor UbiK family protein [Alphaproteobacteria bacterium]TAD91613.1 MAG: accessory factor UbiK family protein [Alphaproteobacteria bacterium]